MKINAFTLNLSSSRTETVTTQVRQEKGFLSLMDARLGMSPGFGMAAGSPWVTHLLIDGQAAVSLTDQFRAELGNLRRVMAAILEACQNRGLGGFRLTRVSQIYAQATAAVAPVQSWQYTQSVRQTFSVREAVGVTGGGVVRTADHREIRFSLDLSMERQFFRQSYVEQTVTGYTLIDPLVIRTDARAPLFSGSTFSFDLDLDGQAQDLPLPGPGYGFLSLDLNQDGRINDGSELFGPSTGRGFAELAAYDRDKNLWIDENDTIFDQLTLWEPGKEGMALTRLRDAGIGAIYLAAVATPFDLVNPDNEVLGQVTATSLALTEEGRALPVQELDYRV